MSELRHDGEEAFVERVARVLRAPEHFDDSFEDSLIAEMRAERLVRRGKAHRWQVLTLAWWASPMRLQLSPLGGLAVVAALAAAASLSTLRMARPIVRPRFVAAAPAVHDTVTLVRFVFVGQARTVAVVGDFNGWGVEPTPLRSTGKGDAWATSVPLARGRHEYAFIVDGRRWTPDPFAPASSDEFDTNSSVITVGD